MKAENDFSLILRTFAEAKIDFIVVGAIAVIAQGIILTTDDVDVVYSRARENLTRIVAALTPFEPYLRGAPLGLPLHLDERTLRNGLNFTFETKHRKCRSAWRSQWRRNVRGTEAFCGNQNRFWRSIPQRRTRKVDRS